MLDGIRVIECSLLGPAAIDVAPRRLRCRGDQGRGAVGRLRAPDDVADHQRHLAAAPPPQPGQAVARARPEGARGGRRCSRSWCASRDVVIEAMRPGFLDKRGLGFERLSELNPAIVMCTISGYGATGPYRDLPSHGIAYDTWAGHVAPVVDDDGFARIPRRRPTSASPPVPRSARSAILAALVRAQNDRRGRQHGDRAVRRRRVLRLVPHRDAGRATTSGPTPRSPATRPTTTSAARPASAA